MYPLKRQFITLSNEEKEELTNYILEENYCKICKKKKCEGCLDKNKSVKQILIESYIPLAIKIATDISSNKREDLISVALLALTKAISNLKEHKPFLHPYIIKTIVKSVKSFAILDTVIKVPWNGEKDYKFLRSTLMFSSGIKSKCSCTHGREKYIELIEIVKKVPRDEVEKIILQCIIGGGYSVSDMAELCNLNYSNTSRIKNLLLDRLMKAVKEY